MSRIDKDSVDNWLQYPKAVIHGYWLTPPKKDKSHPHHDSARKFRKQKALQTRKQHRTKVPQNPVHTEKHEEWTRGYLVSVHARRCPPEVLKTPKSRNEQATQPTVKNSTQWRLMPKTGWHHLDVAQLRKGETKQSKTQVIHHGLHHKTVVPN